MLISMRRSRYSWGWFPQPPVQEADGGYRRAVANGANLPGLPAEEDAADALLTSHEADQRYGSPPRPLPIDHREHRRRPRTVEVA
jgi:hypothetical protein